MRRIYYNEGDPRDTYSTKTISSERVIPMSDKLYSLLLEIKKKPLSDKYPFCTPKGSQLSERRLLEVCKRVAKDAFSEEQLCSNINKLVVEDWLNDLKNLPLAQNSIHAYGKQLNHFLNFLFEYSYTQMFRINRQVKTHPEIKEKIIFSDEDITKIFSKLKKKNSNFITTIYLLFYTGLRSSDILTITSDKIDLKNQIINYYSPKRKKFRQIAFHKKLIPVLRNRIKEIKSGEVLCYASVENLGKAISRYLEDLKLNNLGYSARTFRKTFITLCRSRFDMDASVVRELVGHEHGNTTDKYYNQITISKMKEELKKFKNPYRPS